MYSYIYIIFLVIMSLYFIYRNFSANRKGKIVPYSFKKGENPLLATVDILMIILLVVGGYFFITDKIFSWLLLIFYIFVPIIALQTIILNYLLYKKNQDKKIIFKTLIHILLIVISLLSVLNASKGYGVSIKDIL